jgi:Zn-dependent peptidase ImmA (M78 family)
LGLLVSSVLTRLAEQGVVGTVLEKEWAAIQATQPDEAEYCRAVARLGFDPYSAPEGLESAILAASEAFPGQLFSDFLDGVDPAHLDESLNWVSLFSSEDAFEAVAPARGVMDAGVVDVEDTAGMYIRVESTTGQRGDLVIRLRAQMGGHIESTYGPAQDTAWEHAQTFRNVAGSNVLERFRVQDYVVSVTRKVGDPGIQALGRVSEGYFPLVIMGHRVRIKSARFTLSRCLWHFIWDADPAFLVTGAYTDRQKTDRAFAAELLAPAEGIAELLHGEPATASQEDLDDVAEHYGVTPTVIRYQMQNQLLRAG